MSGDKLTGLFGGSSLSLGNNDDNQDSSRPSALRVKIISMGRVAWARAA